MEDRRVIKTKKNLKATLIEMMGEISFEQISITELCKRAEISRITFYAHYSDKYALADDIFSDMLQIMTVLHFFSIPARRKTRILHLHFTLLYWKQLKIIPIKSDRM